MAQLQLQRGSWGKEERREREDRFIRGVDSFYSGYQCPITVSKNQQTANVTQPLIDRSHPAESSTKDCRASGWNPFRNYPGIGWCVFHLSTAGGRPRFHSRHNPPPTDLARHVAYTTNSIGSTVTRESHFKNGLEKRYRIIAFNMLI